MPHMPSEPQHAQQLTQFHGSQRWGQDWNPTFLQVHSQLHLQIQHDEPLPGDSSARLTQEALRNPTPGKHLTLETQHFQTLGVSNSNFFVEGPFLLFLQLSSTSFSHSRACVASAAVLMLSQCVMLAPAEKLQVGPPMSVHPWFTPTLVCTHG